MDFNHQIINQQEPIYHQQIENATTINGNFQHIINSDILPSVDENSDFPYGYRRSDDVMPNIFVHIPLYKNSTNPPSQQQQPQQRPGSRNEIKSEQIKSEIQENQKNEQQNSHVEEFNRLSRTTTLITARPKSVIKCYKCNVCPFISISESALCAHKKSHQEIKPESSTKKLTCPGCENVFYAKKSLETHLKSDHQMAQNEIDLLIISLCEEPDGDDEKLKEKKKSRISIKNVKILQKPNLVVNESNVKNNFTLSAEDCGGQDINTPPRSELFINPFNIQGSRNKISIKNVNILKQPLPENDINYIYSTNFRTDSGMFYDDSNYFHSTNQPPPNAYEESDNEIITEPEHVELQLNQDEENCIKSKIYIKNVDILKNPCFYQPQVTANELFLQNSGCFNYNNLSNNFLDQNESDNHTPDNVVIDIHSNSNSYQNFPSLVDDSNLQKRNKIFIKNVDILKAPNKLHIRTFDELNLLNVDEVQNFQNHQTSSSNDEVVILDDYIMPDLICDDIDGDRNFHNETGNEFIFNVDKNHFEDGNYNLTVDNSISSDEIKTGNEEQNFFTDNFHSQETDEDILFVCAEEIINSNNTTEKIQEEITDEVLLPNIPGKRISILNNLLTEETPTKIDDKTKNLVRRGRPKGHKKSLSLSNKETGFRCPKSCMLKFKLLENLNYHEKCHGEKISEIICPECNSSDFRNWNTLHTHLWRQHQIDMELFSCSICNFKTPILSLLNNTHIKIHSEERNFKCEEKNCGKAFKNTKQLKNHRRTHRKVELVITKCDKCSATFTNPNSLKKHIEKTHNAEEFKCEICGKVISSKEALKSHLLTHDSDKKFHCDYEKCEYATNDHNAIRRHKMRHNKSKHYKCPKCSYTSIQSATYRAHIMRKHADIADELIFNCTKCSFVSINRINFEMHRMKHQPDELETIGTKSQNKIKVKNSLLLTDPSPKKITIPLKSVVPVYPVEQPLIRPAFFANNFSNVENLRFDFEPTPKMVKIADSLKIQEELQTRSGNK